MCRGLLQGLQESIESRSGQHVYLVNDKDLVFPYLRRYAGLFHQRLDMLHRVVGGSIQLKDVERPLLVESLTTLTMSACLPLFGR